MPLRNREAKALALQLVVQIPDDSDIANLTLLYLRELLEWRARGQPAVTLAETMANNVLPLTGSG